MATNKAEFVDFIDYIDRGNNRESMSPARKMGYKSRRNYRRVMGYTHCPDKVTGRQRGKSLSK